MSQSNSHAPEPFPFTATSGTNVVCWSDTLEDILDQVERVYDVGLDEDLAVWKGNRILYVLTSAGAGHWVGPVALG
jgi:hypothetical protein